MWNQVKQGWGITLDPKKNTLYVTDGSDKITRVDATTLKEQSQMTVYNKDGSAQSLLNELEFVGGYIWANIFYQNAMYKICPCTGAILERIDFQPLREIEDAIVKDRGEDYGYDANNNVCNGIAYDQREDAYYVTGKRWNIMFKIQLTQPISKDDDKCQC